MIVTAHAAERWIERVNYQPIIATAAGFRCTNIRLGNGARLVLDGETVVTVIARTMHARENRKNYRPAHVARGKGSTSNPLPVDPGKDL